MGAKKTIGTTISRNGTNIGVLTGIGAPKKEAEIKDVTTIDITDGYDRSMQGIKRGGEITIKGFYDMADTGQAALDAAFEAGSEDAYVITYPAAIGATISFNAIVKSYGPDEANLDDPLAFELVLKINGKPTIAVTASGGLTALALTGAGGAISPAFSAALRSYTYGGVSAASVTITPTAAAHTIKLYIDGVYSQDIVSGAASASIALTINVSKKLTLVAYEAGKTPISYDIVVVKTT